MGFGLCKNVGAGVVERISNMLEVRIPFQESGRSSPSICALLSTVSEEAPWSSVNTAVLMVLAVEHKSQVWLPSLGLASSASFADLADKFACQLPLP